MIHFELIFVWGGRYGLRFIIFAYGYPVVLALFVERSLFSIDFPLHICQKSVDHACGSVCEPTLHSVALIHLSIFIMVPHSW